MDHVTAVADDPGRPPAFDAAVPAVCADRAPLVDRTEAGTRHRVPGDRATGDAERRSARSIEATLPTLEAPTEATR